MSWFSDAFNSAGEWIVDQVESVGDWIGDQADSAWNWLSDSVSGIPLKFFSYMGGLVPGYTFGNVQYFIPNHADGDVSALMSGSKWSGSTITYSLPDSRSDYEWINPSASGYKSLSAETEVAVHAIMAAVGGIVSTGIAYADRGEANIKVAAFEPGSVIQRSHGYYPGVPVYGGDTWLTTGTSTAVMKGSNNYFMAMHELGHSLGLKHPHDSADGLPRMSSYRDSTEYTVMSYNETINRPQTFMQYDIAALQAMYGADFATNSSNTTYSWNSTTGEMYINGASQGRTTGNLVFLTIWDGGGNDTYDMSNYADDAVIDLAAGGYSRFSNAQLARKDVGTKVSGNVYNAFQYKHDNRSLIENAVAGAGNDKILGNHANNVLQGMNGTDELQGKLGHDTLDGGSGDDTLEGGSGSDVLRGGVGYDFASYYYAAGDVVANLSDASENKNEAYGDTYDSIEALSGSAYNDTLTGNWDGNNLYGHGGDDRLSGLAGRDYLLGGAGNDMLIGGAEADWLVGGTGLDLAGYTTAVTANLLDSTQNTGEAAGDTYEGIEGLTGSNFADHLTGDYADNTIYGGYGADTILGLLGNDRLLGGDDGDKLIGGAGADTLDGGNGFDFAEYHTATAGVVADLMHASRNTGDAAGDAYVLVEGLTGSQFGDDLAGNHQANEIYGLTGNDALEGRGGGDWLYGGAGHDFATYYGATAGVTANLSESWRNQGEAAGDMYFAIEGLAGSAYADALGGNEHYNELFGHGGNDELWGFGNGDWLVGGDGHDLLIGGAGSDWLTGGTGSDIFRFDSALGVGNVDTVNDFTVGSDLLQLTRNTFTAFANQGSVYATQLTLASAATTAAHRLVYNSSTGELSYDADGVGGTAQVQFATLGKGLAITASSFALLWL